jgi:type III secretion system FlhB-like substrate exporter
MKHVQNSTPSVAVGEDGGEVAPEAVDKVDADEVEVCVEDDIVVDNVVEATLADEVPDDVIRVVVLAEDVEDREAEM